MYRFTPPTTTYRAGREGTLWGRVKNVRGLAVVLYDGGVVKTLDVAPSASDAGVVSVWPGGRTYDITDEQAAVLTAAGYSTYLEPA